MVRENAMKNDKPEPRRQPSAIEILKAKNSQMEAEELALHLASISPWRAAIENHGFAMAKKQGSLN